MTWYQQHATFSGSKWCLRGNDRHWGNIYKLYGLYIFLREGHHFVLYVLNGEATLWHKLNKLYSFLTPTESSARSALAGPGPPLNPLNTLRLFSAIFWFFILQHLWKMHLLPIQVFFSHKRMHIIKERKKKNFTARSSNCSVTAKVCPMLVETPYSGGVINPKTYFNQE